MTDEPRMSDETLHQLLLGILNEPMPRERRRMAQDWGREVFACYCYALKRSNSRRDLAIIKGMNLTREQADELSVRSAIKRRDKLAREFKEDDQILFELPGEADEPEHSHHD